MREGFSNSLIELFNLSRLCAGAGVCLFIPFQARTMQTSDYPNRNETLKFIRLNKPVLCIQLLDIKN